MKRTMMACWVIFSFLMAAYTSVAGDQDFTIVNKTGVEINAVFVSPTAAEDWQEDVLGDDTLSDGEKVEITFSSDEDVALWDLKVEDDKGNAIYWNGLNLLEISILTLKYDANTGKATALVE